MGRLKKLKFMMILVFLLFVSCSNKTEIVSKNISDKNERIQKLIVEIKYFSGIRDAEFDLYNVNGFSDDFVMIPGSSSIDYKFVVKVNPKKVADWTTDLEKTTGDIRAEKWVNSLIETRKNNWQTTSKPIFYKRKDDDTIRVIVFEKEGIIFKHILKL